MRLHHGLFGLLVLALTSLAYGLNYMYFTVEEQSIFGDWIHWHSGDTLLGHIRTNGCFAPPGYPSAWVPMIMTCDTSTNRPVEPPWNLPYAHPQRIEINAPALSWPQNVDWVRQWAREQGHYINWGDSLQFRVEIAGDSLKLWWAALGAPVDTSVFSWYPLPDSAVLFFESEEVHLFGTVSTTLIIGVGGRAGLEDNILYASAERNRGTAPAGHPERFALIAEDEIKVLNTWANGRENGGDWGYNAPHSRGSIILDGFYVAVQGSFTFDQQNDPDSGYVYCNGVHWRRRDERGTVFVFGGVAQNRRGYLHRSTCHSTGYLHQYCPDPDLLDWNIGLFTELQGTSLGPLAFDFGAVVLGDTARDTLRYWSDYTPAFPRLYDPEGQPSLAPFHVPNMDWRMELDSLEWVWELPIAFAPTASGDFADTLWFWSTGRILPITFHGIGRDTTTQADDPSFILPPSSFSLSAAPNPFNPRTTIHFTMPVEGPVTLELLDLLGRRVALLAEGRVPAGECAYPVDGAALPSGLYFARLTTPQRQHTIKLALLK